MDESEIRETTNRYYKELRNSGDKFSFQEKRYIDALLPQEHTFIRSHKVLSKDLPNDSSPITLIILVGATFEHLLQSITVHAPQRLIPIVNQYYGDGAYFSDETSERQSKSGDEHWQDLLDLINVLPIVKDNTLSDVPEECIPVDDTPDAVYQFLRAHKQLQEDLRNPQQRVVIDITGAKKTMVAGAFLFAAYTNAEIWYIDPQVLNGSTPYGYSSKYRKISNPIHQLALGQWQQLEQLYTQYNFSSALQILSTLSIVPTLQKSAPNQHLNSFLEILLDWESGRLSEAYSNAQHLLQENPSLAALLPPIITRAGRYWPQVLATRPKLLPEFFVSPTIVMLYAVDELARARRLAGILEAGKLQHQTKIAGTRHDYRAAFTRAYALHETLLKARVFLQRTYQVELNPSAERRAESTHWILSLGREASINWLLGNSIRGKRSFKTKNNNRMNQHWIVQH